MTKLAEVPGRLGIAPCLIGGVRNRGVHVIDDIGSVPHHRPMPRSHSIWHVVFDGCQSLDTVGPFEVFAGANKAADSLAPKRPAGAGNESVGPGGLRYVQTLVSLDGSPVVTESGLEITTTATADMTGTPDTLLIAGGDGVHHAAAIADLTDWVGDVGQRVPRLVTVCTGTFVAARAGLLDGHHVATHWARAKRLQRDHPELTVDADALYLKSGSVWTSAGVTAGMDLALALVEHDHSPQVAQIVARWLVLHLRRPGGQSQFAAPVWFEPSRIDAVRHAQQLVDADPTADHSIAALGAAVGVSARHLTRLFQAELDLSPARYVERVRVERARSLLDSTDLNTAEIAKQAGFRSAETMRRAFHRRLGASPDDYRQRFALSERGQTTTPTREASTP